MLLIKKLLAQFYQPGTKIRQGQPPKIATHRKEWIRATYADSIPVHQHT
jgi:hypothetical protein